MTLTKFLLVLIILSSWMGSYSQVVNKFGIKGGLIISEFSINSTFPDHMVSYPKEGYRYLSADIGIFAEFFDSRYFCISTELHYRTKGEQNGKDFRIFQPMTVNNHEIYENGNANNRFQYLALEILPRWKYIVNTEDRLYLFAGPSLCYRIGNSNSDTERSFEFSNSVFEPGFVLGIGNEIWELLSIELRYEHSFANTYQFVYRDHTLTRKHSSFLLQTGISLKKLFKINL